MVFDIHETFPHTRRKDSQLTNFARFLDIGIARASRGEYISLRIKCKLYGDNSELKQEEA